MKFMPEILNHILSFMDFSQYGQINLYPHLCIQTYYKRYPMAQLRTHIDQFTPFDCSAINNVFSCYKCLVIYPNIDLATKHSTESILYITHLIILCFDTILYECIKVLTGRSTHEEPFIVMYGLTNNVNFVLIMIRELPDNEWSFCFKYIPKQTRQLNRVRRLLRRVL